MLVRLLKEAFRPFTFRGKARLLHALCPKEGEQTVKIFGYSIDLDLSDYIQRSIYLNTFEQDESTWVKGYLKRGMTFVDVGANVGYYSLMAASLVGTEGKVLAFEPSPYAFGRLATAIRKNSLAQVQVAQVGLSDVSGELQLYMPKTSGNHTPSMIANDGGAPINVPVRRLDDYLMAAKVDHVDLMKIDVEGFEPNVLRGTESFLKTGRISAILCEFNNYWLEANNTNSSRLCKEIIQHGYRLASGNPDFHVGCQNLLFKLSS
jgi:FkbM family methyltransferase